MKNRLYLQCSRLELSTIWPEKSHFCNPMDSSQNHYRSPYRSMARLKSMWSLNIWVTIGLLLTWSSVSAALTGSSLMRTDTFDTLDAASFCDARRFDVVEGTSGIVYSHKPYYPSSTYRPGRDCFMTLKAPIGYRIELVALEFQVGERFAGQSRKCAGDSLHIFDQDKPDPSPKKTRSHPSEYQDEKSLTAILSSNTSVQSPIKANLCGRLKNNTIIARSTMNIMTLWWHSDSTSTSTPSPSSASNANTQTTVAKRGFKLQWTAFRESAAVGCDEGKEFACTSQNICIPVELACDNLAHCTDKSDLLPERQRSVGCEDVEPETASSSSPVSVGSLAGICIGSLLLFILALILLSVCRKRRLNMRRQHKYNQAPMAASSTPVDKHYIVSHGPGTVQSSGLAQSSNSSSDNSRCASGSTSTDSRNAACPNWYTTPQQQQMFAHPYPLQQGLYHQINSEAPTVTQNGTYYQPYYVAENGEPYQTKLYHHHHHHHAQHPSAPPPSMVNASVGIAYQNGKHPAYYYPQKQQQGLSDATQPMIA